MSSLATPLISTSAPTIVVENLSKVYPIALKSPGLKGTLQHFWQRRYRQILAVQDISFTIPPGAMVGFLGANGAGKTTTLKMLTGLIKPSGGKVRVAGFDPFRRQTAFLRRTSLVMGQKQQLIWDLPTLDSLRINGAIYEIPDQVFEQRLGELSEMLDLTTELKQPVRKLSLGQRMKAELLAALLHHPTVLFLDEPTLGLDVNAQVAVRQFLQEYNRRYQATVLLTSHYMADITTLCERVLLIHQGQLMYDGDLEALVERFSPYRQVAVELSAPIALEKLELYGEVESVEGLLVRFLLKRERLTTAIAKLLAELPVSDLSVSDPPIEEIIGRLFSQGNLDNKL